MRCRGASSKKYGKGRCRARPEENHTRHVCQLSGLTRRQLYLRFLFCSRRFASQSLEHKAHSSDYKKPETKPAQKVGSWSRRCISPHESGAYADRAGRVERSCRHLTALCSDPVLHGVVPPASRSVPSPCDISLVDVFLLTSIYRSVIYRVKSYYASSAEKMAS